MYTFIPIREPHCVALHSFDAAGPGELSIRPGDVILLVEKIDTDWVKGRLKGQEGMFPLGFVEVKVELSSTSKASAQPPATFGTGESTTPLSLPMNIYPPIIGEFVHKTLVARLWPTNIALSRWTDYHSNRLYA